MATVNSILLNAAVCVETPAQPRSLMVLPLNLIALVVAHIDDVGDLSRLCRTCRVLNYMAIPLLYKNTTLTSYDKIRYRDDLPEGCGSASPFSMGLNAIVTRNVAPLVHSLTMRGEWRDDGLDEHAIVGRVPDSSMMLNITVRAAIDKMTALESFNWELNTKLLETAYIGLAQLPKLTSLTIRFPSSRHPRPTTTIPALPHLRSLKITDIDPLCYPDDISTLLLSSKKLRELKMHWSPRMREAQEPSVTLHDYFRKCLAAKTALRLKRIAFQNFYALHSPDFETVIDGNILEEVSVLNSPGDYNITEEAVTFVEKSWPQPNKTCQNIKSFRHDRLDKKGCDFLGSLVNLERLYFVTSIRDPSDSVNSPRPTRSSPSSASLSPSSGPTSSHTNLNGSSLTCRSPYPPPMNAASQLSLRDSYIRTISTVSGKRLRHLLLPSRWALPKTHIARLVHSCPNLEQLALATDLSSFETLGVLLPFLRKLEALRLLIPTGPAATNLTPPKAPGGPATADNFPSAANLGPGPIDSWSLSEIVELDDRLLNEAIGMRLADKNTCSTLQLIGLGWKAWELGEFYTIPLTEPSNIYQWASSQSQNITESCSASNHAAHANTLSATSSEPFSQPMDTYQVPISGAPMWNRQQTAVGSSKSVLGKRKHSSQTPFTPHGILPESSIYPTPTCSQMGFQPNPGDGGMVPLHSAHPGTLLDELANLSEGTKAHMAQCMQGPTTSSINGTTVQWRRKVRRVEWDVLKHWEVWALDAQHI